MRSVRFIVLGFLLCFHEGATKKRRDRTEKLIAVNIGEATVTGRRVKTGDAFIAGFTGIPYAESPVGEKRFAKPNKRAYSKGERIDATVLPPACLQNYYPPSPDFFSPQLSYSEDCLYLNIITKHHWINNGLSKPVLFYIHGGSFSNGDGISRDGSGLVEYADVVLVSVNYRLQLMGFLNSDSRIPENLGLWDVVTALQWVQDNIAAFGGDRDRVTIMGESAGGAIVSYLHTSPRTKGLFASSISLSGSMTAPWAFTRVSMFEQQRKWDILLNTTGCVDSVDMLTCLRAANESIILDTMENTQKEFPIDTWPPILDNELVLDRPRVTINNGTYPKRPLLSGICNDEGSIMAMAFAGINGIDLLPDSAKLSSKEDVRMLSINHPLNKNFTMPCMKDNGDELLLYFTNTSGRDLRGDLASLLGDWLLFCPQIITADLLSARNNSVYQYVFDYLSNNRKNGVPSWMGVVHGEDMAYLLGLPFSTNSPFYNKNYTKQWGPMDKQVSKLMMDMISGFMRNGAPVVKGSKNTVCWDSIKEKERYLLVTSGKAGTKDLSPTINHCENMYKILQRQAVQCK